MAEILLIRRKTLSNQLINQQFAPPLSKIASYLVWLKDPVHKDLIWLLHHLIYREQNGPCQM